MAQLPSKYAQGDQVSYRNLSSATAQCEILAVHWNKVNSEWQYNILSASGARKLNVRESDLLTDENRRLRTSPKK